MTGHITEIKTSTKTGKRFGYVEGEDTRPYFLPFDPKYYLSQDGIDLLQEGDIVEFTPLVREGLPHVWANNIRIVQHKDDLAKPSAPSKVGTTYYLPGYSNTMLRGMAKKSSLKTGSGEIEVLDKFADVLRISYAQSHNLGHGNMFPFCILGATELLKQYINGGHEFIVVFSHFDSKRFQQSSLTAIKEIRKRKDVSLRRPLVNFYILVSNADGFIDAVNSVKGGTDSAIVPFTFDELLACETKDEFANLVLTRFSDYYFENNMLGEKNPIEDDVLLFGDRDKIADSIVQRCLEKKFSGIFGLRRSGKTSVLKAVLRRLDSQLCKYVVIQSRTELESSKSWEIALFDIARKVKIAAQDIVQEDGETRSEFNKRLNLNSSEDDYLKRPGICFVEDIDLYTRNLSSFVIAIDEIELITYNSATSSLWKDLNAYKGFFGALRDCGCALILCGVNSTINERSIIEFEGQSCDNPMYERIHPCTGFSKTYLPAFTNIQTKIMINTLGGYSNIAFDDVYSDINRTFGGQPYAVRQFCSYVYERVKHLRTHDQVFQIRKPTFEALVEEFCNSNAGIELFKTILQHVTIYADEYEMLKRIALSPKKYRSLPNDDISLIDHLEKYGLIERDRLTGFVSFNIQAIQQYMQKALTKRPEDMDNEERRRYIQDCVAQCERKIKKQLLTHYKLNSDIESCRSDLKRIGKKNYGTLNLDEIFNHKKYTLYFSDLRKIIYENWNTLGRSFENKQISRERFNVCMIDLNAGRIDADHYDPEDMKCPQKWEIDDDTLQKFIAANSTFEEYFQFMNI